MVFFIVKCYILAQVLCEEDFAHLRAAYQMKIFLAYKINETDEANKIVNSSVYFSCNCTIKQNWNAFKDLMFVWSKLNSKTFEVEYCLLHHKDNFIPGHYLPGSFSVYCIHATENLIATCIIALGHNNMRRSSEGKTSCPMFQIDYMCNIYSMLKCSTIRALINY